MDEFERLCARFRARAHGPPASKIDALVDLESLRDGRIISFLLQVLADPAEDHAVLIHALEWFRRGYGVPADRRRVADTIRQSLAGHVDPAVRLRAVLALGEFADLEQVQATLGALVLDSAEPVDLRYCALTCLEKAGLTPQCRAFLSQLTADIAFGACAQRALALWRTA